MKKHQIILLILLINALVFLTFIIAWLGFGKYENDPIVIGLILGLSYIIPMVLLSSFIIRNDELSSNQKGVWFTYVLCTGFIGSLHFYQRYKDIINSISLELDTKMKQGPKSLREFDSGSD
ncbi:hypothetical protein [Ekhidna sp.]